MEELIHEELIHPVSSFLVPIFFGLMGMRPDLAVGLGWSRAERWVSSSRTSASHCPSVVKDAVLPPREGTPLLRRVELLAA
jgi:hypothetical protein